MSEQKAKLPSEQIDWHSVSDDTAFARPFGTIRACLDCGALVAGGPTRCARCARDVNREPTGETLIGPGARNPVVAMPDEKRWCDTCKKVDWARCFGDLWRCSDCGEPGEVDAVKMLRAMQGRWNCGQVHEELGPVIVAIESERSIMVANYSKLAAERDDERDARVAERQKRDSVFAATLAAIAAEQCAHGETKERVKLMTEQRDRWMRKESEAIHSWTLATQKLESELTTLRANLEETTGELKRAHAMLDDKRDKLRDAKHARYTAELQRGNAIRAQSSSGRIPVITPGLNFDALPTEEIRIGAHTLTVAEWAGLAERLADTVTLWRSDIRALNSLQARIDKGAVMVSENAVRIRRGDVVLHTWDAIISALTSEVPNAKAE